MSSVPQPLMVRLRLRRIASVWLFGLLMVAKFAFATGCLADGWPKTSAPVTMGASVVTTNNVDADDGSACWHAGKTGCHCSCAHSAAMPADDGLPASMLIVTTVVPTDTSPLRLTRLQTDLRPPIA